MWDVGSSCPFLCSKMTKGQLRLVFSIDHACLDVLDWTGANFKINIM